MTTSSSRTGTWDAILKKIRSRAVRPLFPGWQPTISDDDVKVPKVDFASIGGNASASGPWLPATSDLGGGSNSADGQNENDDQDVRRRRRTTDDDDDDGDDDDEDLRSPPLGEAELP